MSLLLFGEVHKEHWKTEPGTVIGLLNPNPMKQKDGYDGVSGQSELNRTCVHVNTESELHVSERL